jgi:hypothetical protein
MKMFVLNKIQNAIPAGIVNRNSSEKTLIQLNCSATAATIAGSNEEFEEVAIDVDGYTYLCLGSFYDNHFKWRKQSLKVPDEILNKALLSLLRENPFQWRKGTTKFLGDFCSQAKAVTITRSAEGIRLEFVGTPPWSYSIVDGTPKWHYPPVRKLSFVFTDEISFCKAVFQGATYRVFPSLPNELANYILYKKWGLSE